MSRYALHSSWTSALALLETEPDMLLVAQLMYLHTRTEFGFVFSLALYAKQFSKEDEKNLARGLKVTFQAKYTCAHRINESLKYICKIPSLHITFPIQHVFRTLPENEGLYEYPLICVSPTYYLILFLKHELPGQGFFSNYWKSLFIHLSSLSGFLQLYKYNSDL